MSLSPKTKGQKTVPKSVHFKYINDFSKPIFSNPNLRQLMGQYLVLEEKTY